MPEVKRQRVEMPLNGSGIRDIARVLQVGPTTVSKELKKAPGLSPVNKAVVEGGCPDALAVEVWRVEAAEVDEMGSFVKSKARQRWLWHAIARLTGVVLAYRLGSRAEEGFLQLQKLLKPLDSSTSIPKRRGATTVPSLPPTPLAKPIHTRANVTI
jgi:hypothetical protein